MSDNGKLALLFTLTSAAAFLWFTDTGRKAAAAAGSAIATGVERVTDLFDSTLQLIKRFEGFSPTPYPDAQGYSIGYGHFILPGEAYQYLTEPEAYELLRSDARKFADTVKRTVTVELSQNQFDALVSLAYNIGASAFANSTLVKLLNAGDYDGAAAQFARWNKSQGAVLPALVARRETERQMFVA